MLALLVVVLLVGALSDPAFTAHSVANSLQICARTIVPALFVYMVLADWLIKSGTLRNVGKIFLKPGDIIGIGGEGISIFLIGILCGFPVGARLTAELYERGGIDKPSAEYLNIISNNASLPFIFGVVGGIFGRHGAWIVFTAQLVGAVINGIAFRIILGIKKRKVTKIFVTKKNYKLTESIVKSGATMVSICASVAFFGFLGDITEAVLSVAKTYQYIPIKGLFEFSSGVISCEQLNSNFALPVVAFFCCFGGLSVFGQVKTVLENKIDAKFYLPAKLCHGIYGALATIIFSRIV